MLGLQSHREGCVGQPVAGVQTEASAKLYSGVEGEPWVGSASLSGDLNSIL